MITSYAIAMSDSCTNLIATVTAYIHEGWQPVGGHSVSYSPGQFPQWSQALVKITETPQ